MTIQLTVNYFGWAAGPIAALVREEAGAPVPVDRPAQVYSRISSYPVRTMQTSSRQIDRSPARWILVLIASIFVLAALVHIVSDSRTFTASQSPQAGDVTCSVVCDAATITTPLPEVPSGDVMIVAVITGVLIMSIEAVGVTRRRAPSLIALSISRT